MIRPERERRKETYNMRSNVKVSIPQQLSTRLECGAETLAFESSPSTHFHRKQYRREFREDPLMWSLALMIHLPAIAANLVEQDIHV